MNLGEVVNAEDPFKEVIFTVMKILLSEEERALVSEMNEYPNNLSRHLLIRLSDLEGRPSKIWALLAGVEKAGRAARSPRLPCP